MGLNFVKLRILSQSIVSVDIIFKFTRYIKECKTVINKTYVVIN